MAKAYKIRLTHKIDETTITVPCKLISVKSKDFIEKPRIIKRGPNGLIVKRKSVTRESLNKYNKSNNPDDIELGAGKNTYVYINERGEVVDKNKIQDYHVNPETGKEEKVEPFEPTVGKGNEVEIKKTPSAKEKDNFLISKTLSITCDPSDAPMLFKIAEDLEENDEMGVIDVVLSESYKKYIGMIVPYIDRMKNRFEMRIYVSRARFKPNWIEIEEEAPEKVPEKKTIDMPGAEEMFSAYASPDKNDKVLVLAEDEIEEEEEYQWSTERTLIFGLGGIAIGALLTHLFD